MKTMHIGEFKAQFSEVVEKVKRGDIVRVVKGRGNEVVGYFTLKMDDEAKQSKRVLGQWKDKGCIIAEDFLETSAEEFDLTS
jgi:hypothetical protein